VLVAETAHEPAAGARDLRRVEREALVLGDAEVDRAQLGEPGRGAVLAPAASDAVEPLGLVAYADLLQLDPRAEHRRQLADELPEVDSLLGREVEGELPPVPLPLGVGQLHHQAVGLHPLDGAPSGDLVLLGQLRCARLVLERRQPQRTPRRGAGRQPVRDAGSALVRQLPRRVHAAEILPTVSLDDHRRPERREILGLPEEELFAVAPKGDFDQLRHVG
jgi:hypothetical protein